MKLKFVYSGEEVIYAEGEDPLTRILKREKTRQDAERGQGQPVHRP